MTTQMRVAQRVRAILSILSRAGQEVPDSARVPGAVRPVRRQDRGVPRGLTIYEELVGEGTLVPFTGLLDGDCAELGVAPVDVPVLLISSRSEV